MEDGEREGGVGAVGGQNPGDWRVTCFVNALKKPSAAIFQVGGGWERIRIRRSEEGEAKVEGGEMQGAGVPYVPVIPNLCPNKTFSPGMKYSNQCPLHTRCQFTITNPQCSHQFYY